MTMTTELVTVGGEAMGREHGKEDDWRNSPSAREMTDVGSMAQNLWAWTLCLLPIALYTEGLGPFHYLGR